MNTSLLENGFACTITGNEHFIQRVSFSFFPYWNDYLHLFPKWKLVVIIPWKLNKLRNESPWIYFPTCNLLAWRKWSFKLINFLNAYLTFFFWYLLGMVRSAFFFIGRALIFLHFFVGIQAWGREGHYVICKIAEVYRWT